MAIVEPAVPARAAPPGWWRATSSAHALAVPRPRPVLSLSTSSSRSSSFYVSFYDWDGLGEMNGSAGRTTANSTRPAFYTSLWNNVHLAGALPAGDPAGLFIALFLNQTVRGIRLYKSLFFFPFVISQVVVGLIFSWFYARTSGF
jgi:multiple sugar transport system permease protein